MNILLASSEVVPFAKTGGLADVAGALPGEIKRQGHEICVFMPAYGSIDHSTIETQHLDVELEIPMGNKIVQGRLIKSKLPGTDVDVYLVDQHNYYHRQQIYGEPGSEYEDNCERFTFFCRSVLESIRLLDLNIDLIHCNDWQTGLIPALLKCEYHENALYERIKSLLTIHNLAYQGSFWHWDMLLTGLDWKHFNWQQMEHYGRLNFLKTAIIFADAINTVSPTYAREIQTPEQGFGLEGALQHRANVLSGILNGIDSEVWNPAIDPLIPANFTGPDSPHDGLSKEMLHGKSVCKRELQLEMQLTPEPDTPLIGIVARLATQKGWALILPVMKKWLESINVQWVILGTGDPDYHHILTTLHRQYPHKVSVNLGFSNKLAHCIEAGADMFLIPSEYEPCGLNQMYSMAYGTVPVVRNTGGLADTVLHATPETIEQGTATGFSFDGFDQTSFEWALGEAIQMYRKDRKSWHQLMANGMAHDWSWSISAKQYCDLYAQTINSDAYAGM